MSSHIFTLLVFHRILGKRPFSGNAETGISAKYRSIKGFTVLQTAEKHVWPESLLLVINIAGKNDAAKYKEL
jgi:hypothetical protein